MMKNYVGALGNFSYDDAAFALKPHPLDQDRQILKYIGNEDNGHNIQIPEGIKDCSYMFEGCFALRPAPVIPEGVQDITGMFKDCSGLLTTPDIPQSVTILSRAFEGCIALENAKILPDKAVDVEGMFSGCRSLYNHPPILTETVERAGFMFEGCASLMTPIYIKEGGNSIDCGKMYSGCESLAYANQLPERVSDFSGMYEGCSDKIQTAAEWMQEHRGEQYEVLTAELADYDYELE